MMSKQCIKRLTTKPNERVHNILETKLDNNNYSSVISVVMMAIALITFDNTI